jgi:hypothetical protein
MAQWLVSSIIMPIILGLLIGAARPQLSTVGMMRAALQGSESAMKERRFGRTIKMPATLQLKHQILRDRFEQAQKTAALPASARSIPRSAGQQFSLSTKQVA